MNILNRNEINQISGGTNLIECTITLDDRAPVQVTSPNGGEFSEYLHLFCDAGVAKSITYTCKPFYNPSNSWSGEHNCK